MTQKTNAARLLDSLGIPYELRTYDVDEDDLSAASVARKIGFPLDQVFKTLVVEGDRTGILLAVIPGDCELDLKAIARASGNRKCDTVPLKDVLPLTGYMRGAVTVFGCRKEYPVFVEETIILFDRVSVSAGMRGMQLLLAPDSYLQAAKAQIASIARPAPPRNA